MRNMGILVPRPLWNVRESPSVSLNLLKMLYLKMTLFLAFSSFVSKPKVHSSFVLRHQDESFKVFPCYLYKHMFIRLKWGAEMST